MNSKSIYNKIFEKKCAVCGHTYLADIYDQGECKNCGWYNGFMYSEHPDKVMFSNLISLNKAKNLYSKGLLLKPDLQDFLDGLYYYGEMEFTYKNVNFELYLKEDDKGEDLIEFSWTPEDFQYYKNKQEFIENAHIGNVKVKDIWNEVENPKYM